MPEKVRALKASDGQLFLDGGKLVTHELKRVIVGVKYDNGTVVASGEDGAELIAAALTENHVVLFDALKLLKVPKKRKAVVTAPTPAGRKSDGK